MTLTIWHIYGRTEKNVKGKNKFVSKSISWSINPLKPIKITVKDSQVGQGGQRGWNSFPTFIVFFEGFPKFIIEEHL